MPRQARDESPFPQFLFSTSWIFWSGMILVRSAIVVQPLRLPFQCDPGDNVEALDE